VCSSDLSLARLRLFYYRDGQWEDCTTHVDVENCIIRGTVASLSTFVVVEPVQGSVVTYDVTADWSDVVNPNGAWSYWLNGSLAQPGTRWYDVFDIPPGPPPIWTGSTGSWHFFGWSQSNGSEQINGYDLEVGDIYGHTMGELEIRWTSPLAGPIQVSGGAWALRDVGRMNCWTVTLNGKPLQNGWIYSGDPYSRVNPAPIALALDVAVGDVLSFRAWPSGDYGDYIGLNLSIDPVALNTPTGENVPVVLDTSDGAVGALAAAVVTVAAFEYAELPDPLYARTFRV